MRCVVEGCEQGRNARKTHCKHGHEFSAENTRVETYRRRSNGKTYSARKCRACERAAHQRYRANRKVA